MLGERIFYRGGCRAKAMMSIAFFWSWSEVAQNPPDAQPSSSSGSECDAVLGPRQPGLGQGWSLDGALMVSGPRRSMPHMTRQEWYEMYKTRCPPGSAPSSRHTFDRTYDRRADSLVQKVAEGSLMLSHAVSCWDRTILNFDVDWMDQAKFRCPPTLL